jgi:hypothetical protein
LIKLTIEGRIAKIEGRIAKIEGITARMEENNLMDVRHHRRSTSVQEYSS